MPRPSRNTDRMLIEAAKILLPRTGVSGLKVRQVAKKAGVNLGMFHYYFRTKEEFVQEVLKEIYNDFFSGFEIKLSREGSPVERLKSAIISLGCFARDNRQIILAVIRDMLHGDKGTIRFAGKNFTRHISVLANLVYECQKKGYLIKIPLPHAVAFIAGNIAFPNAIMEIIDKSGAKNPMGIKKEFLENQLLSDKAIETRAGLVIKALSTEIQKTNHR